MSDASLREAIIAALRTVAPEVEPASLRGDLPLREQVDLDSMDFLNFLVELHRRLGVDIPEADYAQVQTLDACSRYVSARLQGTSPK
ncbi:MAG TPA: acyl carrier protein [Gemmatimonadaceae bacterium]|nr:acyl carrier protein [Gemmatimonadaceae bacterium]